MFWNQLLNEAKRDESLPSFNKFNRMHFSGFCQVVYPFSNYYNVKFFIFLSVIELVKVIVVVR